MAMVIAYEDIGLANPAACAHTVAAVQAADQLGFPEARIPLADAVIELALSPKSNSGISAIDAALTTVRDGHFGDIPADIKDAHYQGAAKLGHGVGYDFPPNHPGDRVLNSIYQMPSNQPSITSPKQMAATKQPLRNNTKNY